MDMVNSLPSDKRARVAGWFDERRSTNRFKWRDLLQHFRDEFEDQQAKLTAGEELLRIEQGAHQYFCDFLRDFEYKVAVSGGSTVWTSGSKVNMLNAAVNKKLRRALVPVKLPPTLNYQAFVAELKEVAGKLEALSDYRPKGSTQTGTKLGAPKGGNSLFVASNPQTDEEGDTIMGGTNALVATIASMIQQQLEGGISSMGLARGKSNGGHREAGRKPQAPWRSRNEFRKLVEKGVCVRCTRPGHLGRDCPTFRAARRPGAELHAGEIEKETSGELDSGNEDP
ncbi:hypothetical protein K3495_g14804 [Podosphaera aphanis]|nr:hypothetical protein K3495_g14804 [Podosphaera aphanis]